MLDLSKTDTPVNVESQPAVPEKPLKKVKPPKPVLPWYMQILNALLGNLIGKMFIWTVLVFLFGVVAPTDFEKLMAALGTGVFWIWWLH